MRPPWSGAEGERVADERPDDADEAHREEAVHDRGEHVLRRDHAAVEQGEPRCHEQHQCRRDQHPRGVAGVDLHPVPSLAAVCESRAPARYCAGRYRRFVAARFPAGVRPKKHATFPKERGKPPDAGRQEAGSAAASGRDVGGRGPGGRTAARPEPCFPGYMEVRRESLRRVRTLAKGNPDPCPSTTSPSAAPASTTSRTRPRHPARQARRDHRPVRLRQVARSRSTPSTPRGSAATSSRSRPTRASSSARWRSRTSTTSRACRPAISIDQKTTSRNPRSTVGTVTEIYDYLRLLFARVGIPHCPACGRVIERQTPQQIVDRIAELPEGTKFLVLAPVVQGPQGRVRQAARGPAARRASRASAWTARCASSTRTSPLDKKSSTTSRSSSTGSS